MKNIFDLSGCILLEYFNMKTVSYEQFFPWLKWSSNVLSKWVWKESYASVKQGLRYGYLRFLVINLHIGLVLVLYFDLLISIVFLSGD